MATTPEPAPLPDAPATDAPQSPSIDDWLRRESTKLALSALDDRRKTRRGAAVLLWSAAAYVCVAAGGYKLTQTSIAEQLQGIRGEATKLEARLTEAKQAEDSALHQHLEAVYRSERLAGRVLVAGKDVEISVRQQGLIKESIAAAEQTYDAAKKELGKVQGQIAAIQRDAVARGDYRDLVKPELKHDLKLAQEKLAAAKSELDKLRSSKLDGTVGPSNSAPVAASGAIAAGKPVNPMQADLEHRASLDELAQAKQEQVQLENEWVQAQRELNAVRTGRDAARAEQEKLEREPNPLKLPVLNLEVKPAHFFGLAPLLLTTLYWSLALIEHPLGRLLRGLREQMRVQSVDRSALALAMPELAVVHATRFHRLRALLPDIATGAALVLLACAGPAYVSSIALAATIVTAAYRVRALVGSK